MDLDRMMDGLAVKLTVNLGGKPLAESGRHCGGCTACCKTLPTAEINKPALTRCQHQRFGKGCAIYDKRPMSCRLWSCGWLLGDRTEELSRPDRSGLVIDMMPDFVTLKYDGGQPDVKIPVIQVWIDPAKPDAHRDPAFRRYVARRGEEEGMMALIRIGSMDAWVLCPPCLAHDGQWHEQKTNTAHGPSHSFLDVAKAFQEMSK